ncbi:hypothetical protein G5C60_17435 [Streptomyces sp. HC44]|uniref:Uncharacterized protein n=1 Tax=Streptomyces scabichelini TaxID=2711217 RepID=A0A6G4V5H2_9ACTN|nr:hypothetical protein [Streptomyces scabichelini]NGO09332.1 hypothetical protein [Streptomyces scabichelini]
MTTMTTMKTTMTTRILGIELRRSSAAVIGALIAALGVAGLWLLVLSGQGELWDRQWTLLAAFQRIMLVVLWPLALGGGAWQARRDRRCGVEELLGTTSLPTWRRMLPTAVALAVCLVLGYVVTLAAGAVRVVGSTGYLPAGWLPIASVGALALVAAGWLGMGLGRLIPSAYTPPVLVVAGFMVLLLPIQLAKSSEPGAATLLAPNLTSDFDEFTTIAGSVSLAQSLWFTGLAGSGLLLVLVARRRAAIVAGVPALFGLLLAMPLLNAAPASGLQPDQGASAEVCTDDGGPKVCVTKAHEQGLKSLTGPARRALKLLAKLPDAPTSVHEVTGDRPGPQPADQAWLHSDYYESDRGWDAYSEDELVVNILAGAGTRPCEPVAFGPRAVAGAWLYGRYPAPGQDLLPGEESAERDAAWRTLRALPAEEQLRRITAVRTVELSCRGDAEAALTGGAR